MPNIGSFSLSATPTAFIIASGDVIQSNVTVTPTGGYTGSVNLSVTAGMPTDGSLSATFSPSPVSIPGTLAQSSTLTITAGANATPGTYNLTVTGSSDAITATYSPITVTILAPLGVGPSPVPHSVISRESVKPTDSLMPAGVGDPTAGPSGSVSVDLATGLVESHPQPDLVVTNPIGPDVVYQRVYNAAYTGWDYTYDVALTAVGNGNLNLYFPGVAGTDLLSGAAGASGSTTTFTPPQGAPYIATGVGNGNGGYSSITLTFVDDAVMTFVPQAGSTTSYVLSQLNDGHGQSLYFQYAGSSHVQSIGNSPSSPLLTLYWVGNTLSSIVDDVTNRTVQYQYDFTGLTGVSQPQPSGSPSFPQHWAYANQNGALVSISLPDASTGATSISDPATMYVNGGGTAGGVQSLVDANDNVHTFQYFNGATRVTVTDNTGAVVEKYTERFGPEGQDAGTINADGTYSTIAYNDPSNPVSPTMFTNEVGQVAQASYGQYGLPATTTSARGVQTTFGYTPNGFPLGRLNSITSTDQSVPTSLSYSTQGYIQTVTSPMPGVPGSTVSTTYNYDALGNLQSVVLPPPNGSGAPPPNGSGVAVTYTYNYTTDYQYTQAEVLGEPLTLQDPNGNFWHYRYDAMGHVTSEWNSFGVGPDMSYNVAGQLQTVSYSSEFSNFENAAPDTVTYNYPYLGGALTGVTMAVGPNQTLSTADTAQLGHEAESVGQIGYLPTVTNTFDGAYRGKQVLDGKGNGSTYQYDPVGNLKKLLYQNGSQDGDALTYSQFDAAGAPLSYADGNGQTGQFQLDPLDDSVTGIQYAGTAASQNMTCSYYPNGLLQQMTDGQGTYIYTYDDLGNVMTASTQYVGQPSATVLTYTYYPDGHRSALLVNGSTYCSYMYDNDGHLTLLSAPSSGTTTWTYAVDGSLASQTLPCYVTTQYGFDWRGNLQTLTIGGTQTGPLYTSSVLDYDPAGNPFSEYTGYGAQGALIAGQTETAYGYDAAGNVTVGGDGGSLRVYNPKNQLTTDEFGNSYYAYDNNGNPTTYKGQTLTYDQNDNLTAYGSVFSAGYRADGLRAWKQEGATKTYYIYDGDQPIIELNATGGETSNTVFGAAGPISTGSTYYAFDEKGNCQYVFYGSAASSAFIGGSTDYGVSPSSATLPYAGFKGAYGYRGDVSMGLYYCTHRYYDTTLERWLTRDPIGDVGGVNLYEYCDDNPITNADASGLVIELASLDAAGEAITDEDRQSFKIAMAYLRKSKTLRGIIANVQKSSVVWKIIIHHHATTVIDDTDYVGHKINWDPNGGIEILVIGPIGALDTGHSISPALALGHEFYHADAGNRDPGGVNTRLGIYDSDYTNAEEKIAVHVERQAARELGENLRYNHTGVPVWASTPTYKH